MYEFECAFCGVTVIVNKGKQGRRFCSQSCSSKAARGVKPYRVDLDYDWKQVETDKRMYVCRYNEGVNCFDRNCGRCGFNPEVAKRRSDAILKRMEAANGTERIPEETR